MAEIRTQIPGNVWKVLVKNGDRVSAGQALFIMEVMKTEIPHESPIDGRVSEISIVEGQENVDADVVAIVVSEG